MEKQHRRVWPFQDLITPTAQETTLLRCSSLFNARIFAVTARTIFDGCCIEKYPFLLMELCCLIRVRAI